MRNLQVNGERLWASLMELAKIGCYFRHPEDAVLTAMDDDLRQACQEAASASGLEAEVKEFWYFPPTPFHRDLVAAVRDAAAAQGYPHQDIISGAGHDAVYMARIAPSAMVFVPCVGGISHNEIEDAKPEDLTAGCNVLLNAVLDRANAVSTELPSTIQPSGLR